ncbi:creatininase family protein [Zavarzinia sp. CC-PAN008]|uniref:creatininase family protein n=1 Tax=Zavarzinia sp. CC-PAN008 TaxID=3243332 RepID=UPI003F74508E
MEGVWLEDLTWPEAARWFDAGAVVVVPIGAAAKEHGHHLPMMTDYLTARALAQGVAEALPVLVAPVIAHGFYPAFRHYRGSQSLKADTFRRVLEDVLGGLVDDGATRILIINTGVSTEPVVDLAARAIFDATGVRIATGHLRRLGTEVRRTARQRMGGHGDELETSCLLAIAPERVLMDLAERDYGHERTVPAHVLVRPGNLDPDPQSGPDYSATGVFGDPTLASEDLGQRLMTAMVDDLIDGIMALWPEADDLRPVD